MSVRRKVYPWGFCPLVAAGPPPPWWYPELGPPWTEEDTRQMRELAAQAVTLLVPAGAPGEGGRCSRDLAEGEAGYAYLYHVTPHCNRAAIAREGLVPAVPRGIDTDAAHVYLGADRDHLMTFFGERDWEVLRVDVEGLALEEDPSWPHSFRCPATIAPERIAWLGTRQQLQDAAKQAWLAARRRARADG